MQANEVQLPSSHVQTEVGAESELITHVSQGGIVQMAGKDAAGVQSLQQSPRPKVTSIFSSSSLPDTSASQSLGILATYNEVLNKLDGLFEEQLREIQALTESHWKSQEFPLARIKKIMRMDEDVKMISAEVPIMFSKAVEIFITELSLRAWLHTDEAKKRTLQRGDIAMAITKHDMFDFLIDIVPREDIQLKARSKPEGDQVQVISPELLQVLLQQLTQQQVPASTAAGNEQEVGSHPEAGSGNLLQQQIQLLQQLVQLQMLQQEQQPQQHHIEQEVGHMMELQHHAEPSDIGGQALDHSHHIIQTAASTEHLSSQPIQVSHTRTQSVISLPGSQQALHHHPCHSIDDITINVQEAVLGTPPTIIIQQSLLDQGQPSAYQGFHEHRQLPVMVTAQMPNDVHFDGQGSEGVEFQHIPENESISRSISPITAALHSEQDIAYTRRDSSCLMTHVSAATSSSSLQNVPRTT